MITVFRLGKLAHPLMRLLGFKSLVNAVTAMGADKRLFYPILEIKMSSIGPLFHSLALAFEDQAPYELRALINKKEYGFHINLQEAYQSALNFTLLKLKEKILQKHRDIKPNLIETFFEALKADSNQQEQIGYTDWSEIIDAFAYNNKDIAEQVANTLQLDLSLSPGKILHFFINDFPEEMQQTFLEQLLNPEHELANLNFIFYLIESYLHDEYKSQKIVLREINCLLEKVVALPVAKQFHREEAQRLLQLGKELLHKKIQDSEDAPFNSMPEANRASSPLLLYLPGEDKESKQLGLSYYLEANPSFIGYDRELRDLHNFARIEDQAFQWGGLLGPTGIGKSRLTLELCQQLRKLGFTAGFLKAEHLNLLVDYQPDRPTVVVLDGIATIYKQVIEVIEHLYERRNNNPLAKNLRLLLLDRNIYDSWWEFFSTNPQVSQSQVKRSFYLRIDHAFSGLAENDLWQIMQEVYQKRKNENIPYASEEVLKELNRLDSEKKPEFAILVGLMLAEGHYSNLKQWDKTQLLRNFLEQKENEYRQTLETHSKENLDKYESLLLFTTITQGLAEDIIKVFCKEITGNRRWFPEEAERSKYIYLAPIRVDTDSGRYIWEGLPTNMLGEFYVLNQIEKQILESEEQYKTKLLIGSLIQTAWGERPAETRAFINNIVKDFPEQVNSAAYQLLLYTSPTAHASKQVWTERARLFNNLTNVIYTEDELPTFVRYYEVLKNEINFVAEEATKDYLLLWLAKISSGLNSYFLYFEDKEQAETYYQQTAALSNKLKTADFAYWQALTELNYIEYFIKSNHSQQAENYYKHIKDLQKVYTNSEIAWVQAKAAGRLVKYFMGAINYEAARQYYEQIEILHAEFNSLGIALIQANIAHKLANNCIYRKMEELAEHYFSQLTFLNKKYQNYELAMEEYKLIRELIRYYSSDDYTIEKYTEKTEMYYDRMLELDKLLKTF